MLIFIPLLSPVTIRTMATMSLDEKEAGTAATPPTARSSPTTPRGAPPPTPPPSPPTPWQPHRQATGQHFFYRKFASFGAIFSISYPLPCGFMLGGKPDGLVVTALCSGPAWGVGVALEDRRDNTVNSRLSWL